MADPRVLQAFRRAVLREGASPKVQKALFEAGIVESGLRNLNYGDRDSLGALQERTSIYGRGQAMDPYASAVRFIRQAKAVEGKYGKAGDLAQAVQRSAFPARYGQVAGQASQYIQGRGPVGNVSPGAAPAPSSNPDYRKQIALSLLGFGNLAGGQGGDPLTTALQQAVQAQGQNPLPQQTPHGHGVTNFDGKPVAAWIAPILAQARRAGWKGQVTSGERTKAQQLAAAKRFGLQNYPNGPLASNHVIGHDGAVDVTDPQGLKRALQKLHVTALKSAMANDPVHFSRTGH